MGGERGPWAACGPGLGGRNGPPSPSHEAAVTHPGGALGACRFPAGCAGDSPHLRARASAHAGTHAHACTHVHARNTRMHTHARSLSPGALRSHVSTRGDAARLGPRVALPPPCPSHTCHGGGSFVPQWPPAPRPPHCPAGLSHAGSSAGAAQPWARVDTGRAAQRFPAGLRLGAGGWLPPSLLLTNHWATALGPKQGTWGPMRPAPGPEPALPSSTGEGLGTLLRRAPSAQPPPGPAA